MKAPPRRGRDPAKGLVRVRTAVHGIRLPGEWMVFVGEKGDDWPIGGPLSKKSEALHSAEVVRATINYALSRSKEAR